MTCYFFRRTLPLLLKASSALCATAALAENCPVEVAVYQADQQQLRLPTVRIEGGLTYNAQFDLLDTQNAFHFQLTGLSQVADLASTADYQLSEQLIPTGYLSESSQVY